MTDSEHEKRKPTLCWVSELERAVRFQLGSGIKLEVYEFADCPAPLLTDEAKKQALLDELSGIFDLYGAAKAMHGAKETGYENRVHAARQHCEEFLKAIGYSRNKASDESQTRLLHVNADTTVAARTDQFIENFNRHLAWLHELLAKIHTKLVEESHDRNDGKRTEWLHDAQKSAAKLLKELSYNPKETYQTYDRRLTVLPVDGSIWSRRGPFVSFERPLDWFHELGGRLRDAARALSGKNENLTGKMDPQRFLRRRIADCFGKFWDDPAFSIAEGGLVNLTPASITFALPVLRRFIGAEGGSYKLASLKKAYLDDAKHNWLTPFEASIETRDLLRANVRKRSRSTE